MTQKAFCIVISLLLWLNNSTSQESLGFSLDQYSGTHLIDLNPGSSSLSPYKWDITLASFHGFGFSDYASLQKASLLNLASRSRDATVIEGELGIPTDAMGVPLVIFDQDGGRKRLSGHIEAWGPSVMLSIHPTIKVGVFTKTRANVSSFNIPESLGFYELNDARFQAFELDLVPAKLSGMVWHEIGIHGSKTLGPLSFGFNMKYLLGSEGFFVENEATASYPFDPLQLSTVDVPVDLQFGFTNNTINSDTFNPYSNIDTGVGIGFDFGITYQAETYRIGASILDIGRVSFTQNTEIYRLAEQMSIVDLSSYDQLNGVREFLDQIQEDFDVEFDTASAFKVGLPMALSLQGDAHLQDNFYVSAALTNRLPIFPNSLRRDNTLSVIPRYESKWISAFLPVTIYEYSRLRVGAAARLGYLTIGSDHIMSVFTNSDFRGSDIYFKLSFFPGRERVRSSGQSKKGKKGGLECYTF